MPRPVAKTMVNVSPKNRCGEICSQRCLILQQESDVCLDLSLYYPPCYLYTLFVFYNIREHLNWSYHSYLELRNNCVRVPQTNSVPHRPRQSSAITTDRRHSPENGTNGTTAWSSNRRTADRPPGAGMSSLSPKLCARLNCGSQAEEAQSKNAPKKGTIVVCGAPFLFPTFRLIGLCVCV